MSQHPCLRAGPGPRPQALRLACGSAAPQATSRFRVTESAPSDGPSRTRTRSQSESPDSLAGWHLGLLQTVRVVGLSLGEANSSDQAELARRTQAQMSDSCTSGRLRHSRHAGGAAAAHSEAHAHSAAGRLMLTPSRRLPRREPEAPAAAARAASSHGLSPTQTRTRRTGGSSGSMRPQPLNGVKRPGGPGEPSRCDSPGPGPAAP